MKKRFLIIGHGRHGKDTLAEILEIEFGMTFSSSSEYMLPILYPKLKEEFGYADESECYADRINKRDLWYNRICDYNYPNLSRLSTEILETKDAYVGMRDDSEFYASRDEFDLIIFVDASERIKSVDTSMKIPMNEADIIITNNGTLEQFVKKAIRIFKPYFEQK